MDKRQIRRLEIKPLRNSYISVYTRRRTNGSQSEALVNPDDRSTVLYEHAPVVLLLRVRVRVRHGRRPVPEHEPHNGEAPSVG